MSDFEAYLSDMLHRRPVMSLERYGQMVHQAAWPDIVEKAKRLIQSNQVTVLRNAPHHVMAHVIGDHGEYNTEILRTDPSSNVIEQWTCECPWDQFAFNRTRRWKKFEGRVCSHVLATYWRGLSTPLDFQPDEGGPKPFQKQGPPVERVPVSPPGGEPRSFGPETDAQRPSADPYIQQLQQLRQQVKERIKNKQPYLPGEGENLQLPGMRPTSPSEQPPSTRELIMGPEPENPLRMPEMQEYQREDLKLFDLAAPPWNPTPVPPTLPVSVPNADPPDPMNPIDGIGFSSVRSIRPIFGASDDDFTTWFTNARSTGRPTYAQVVRKGVFLEARGGKHPMPGAEPIGQWPDGTPRYKVMDLGYHPEEDRRVRADEVDSQGRQGPPEQRDVMMEVPLNSRCEVTEIDPLLKWCHIIVPMSQQAGMYEPQTMEGWVSYADVKPLDDARNPFIRRRGAVVESANPWKQDVNEAAYPYPEPLVLHSLADGMQNVTPGTAVVREGGELPLTHGDRQDFGYTHYAIMDYTFGPGERRQEADPAFWLSLDGSDPGWGGPYSQEDAEGLANEYRKSEEMLQAAHGGQTARMDWFYHPDHGWQLGAN